MVSKNYLSNKRTTKISFSTSSALTDWLKRYVNKQRKEHPEDDRYKSLSSFIHYCLEKIMVIFEKGKDLDDFDKFLDQKIESFYEEITFKAIIPQIEHATRLNKYQMISKGLLSFYSAFRSVFMKGLEETKDIHKNTMIIISRFQNFAKKNKVSDSIVAERIGDKYILEWKGHYENLHFINCKAIAAIIGICGFRILNTIYTKDKSINHFYMRFDCEITKNILEKRPRQRELITLATQNIEKIINYEEILNDEPEHIWIKASEVKKSVISFQDVETGVSFIESIIENLEATTEFQQIPLKILTLFDYFHWIKIDDEDDLTFHYIIPEEGHEIIFGIMKIFISRYFD